MRRIWVVLNAAPVNLLEKRPLLTIDCWMMEGERGCVEIRINRLPGEPGIRLRLRPGRHGARVGAA